MQAAADTIRRPTDAADGMDLTVHVRARPGDRPTDILIRTAADGTISVHARARQLVDMPPGPAGPEPGPEPRPGWWGRLLGSGGR